MIELEIAFFINKFERIQSQAEFEQGSSCLVRLAAGPNEKAVSPLNVGRNGKVVV